MKIPKSFKTITPFTKALALSMLIVLPFIGFLLGMNYKEALNINTISSLRIYSNKYFSFQYPANWHVSEDDNNVGFVDRKTYKGNINVIWGSSLDLNDERWCNINNTFNFPIEPYSFSEELTGCIKTIGSGNKEYNLQKTLKDGTKIIISANGNTFTENDYPLMFQILSTFKFID